MTSFFDRISAAVRGSIRVHKGKEHVSLSGSNYVIIDPT